MRTVYGKKIRIDTDNIVEHGVQVGNDYYHLSKLFDSEGKSLMYLAWSE